MSSELELGAAETKVRTEIRNGLVRDVAGDVY